MLNINDGRANAFVANLCVNTDYSMLSVLTYAVEVLEVGDWPINVFVIDSLIQHGLLAAAVGAHVRS